MPLFPLVHHRSLVWLETHTRGSVYRDKLALFDFWKQSKGTIATKDVQIARFFRVYIIPAEQYRVESLARAHKSSQCHWPLSQSCQIWTVNSLWQAESNDIKSGARKCVVSQQANWRIPWRTECFLSRALSSVTLHSVLQTICKFWPRNKVERHCLENPHSLLSDSFYRPVRQLVKSNVPPTGHVEELLA